ncbi:MAG TPA: hypothetical protein DCL00_04785 [Opitutae bacterium]|nr:hypothetical protein [Opitutae bacterium]HAF58886.1 hypothetical protein [Opitutae bacterium]
MPIYEFSCLDCSKDSEQLVRSSDWRNEAKCPECGSEKLEKKLSVFTASNSGSDAVDMPPCSGMPSNCGRCSIDN